MAPPPNRQDRMRQRPGYSSNKGQARLTVLVQLAMSDPAGAISSVPKARTGLLRSPSRMNLDQLNAIRREVSRRDRSIGPLMRTNDRPVSGWANRKPDGDNREGYRVPAGIRDPLMQKAATIGADLWGKPFSTGLEGAAASARGGIPGRVDTISRCVGYGKQSYCLVCGGRHSLQHPRLSRVVSRSIVTAKSGKTRPCRVTPPSSRLAAARVAAHALWRQRSMVSMTSIWLPQQGQGGRVSGGSVPDLVRWHCPIESRA